MAPLRSILLAITPPIVVDGYLNLARRYGALNKHRRAVGGEWDFIGKLQFDFLVKQGLKPDHRLLDVGCGSLRGGVHFIRYLDDGNYYGIDRQQWLLDAGKKHELPRYGVADKTVHLLCRDDFDFSQFGVQFDYALAQSVFTHLPWNTIMRCLTNMKLVLKPGGTFYATYFEDPDGSHRVSTITQLPGGRITYPDRDPYHYEFDVFVEMARRVGLTVTRIGSWNHPRNQYVMVFEQTP